MPRSILHCQMNDTRRRPRIIVCHPSQPPSIAVALREIAYFASIDIDEYFMKGDDLKSIITTGISSGETARAVFHRCTISKRLIVAHRRPGMSRVNQQCQPERTQPPSSSTYVAADGENHVPFLAGRQEWNKTGVQKPVTEGEL